MSSTHHRRSHAGLGAAWIAASLLLGCAEGSREIRKHTYPPSFAYVPKKEVDSAMWTLAGDAIAVNDLLRQSESIDADARSKIIEHLDRMLVASQRLDGAGRTNHPLIDANIQHFVKDIELARMQAAADPPNYFMAGSVAGACFYCHGR